jgi:hypothetical protein
MIGKAERELFRLAHAALVERHIRALQDARRVAVSLTVTYEQDRHGLLDCSAGWS